MSIKKFDKLFGLSASIEEEKLHFINRIENSLFNIIIKEPDNINYKNLFEEVCYDLGENAGELMYNRLLRRIIVPNFKTLSNKDFVKTLRIIVAIYGRGNAETKQYVSSCVIDVLERSNLNLGVKWADGIFYPSGDKFLDDELIDISLSLLDNYPDEKTNLKIALDYYYSKNLNGVVHNCYIAIEGLSRQFLDNKKTLDRNKQALLGLLQFSKHFDEIFANYLKYAHEYGRHAGENRHDLKPEEVEAFLYLTCLMIRVTIRVYEERKKIIISK